MNAVKSLLAPRNYSNFIRILSVSKHTEKSKYQPNYGKVWRRRQWMIREMTVVCKDNLETVEKAIKVYESSFRCLSNLGVLGSKIESLLRKYIDRTSESIFPSLEEMREVAENDEDFLTDEEFERWQKFLCDEEKNGVTKEQFQNDLMAVASKRYDYLLGNGKDDKKNNEGLERNTTQSRHLNFIPLSPKNRTSVKSIDLLKTTLLEKSKDLQNSIDTLKKLYPVTDKSFHKVHLVVDGGEKAQKFLQQIQKFVFNDRANDFTSIIHIDEMAKYGDESLSAEEIGRWNKVKEALERNGRSIDDIHNNLMKAIGTVDVVMNEHYDE